MIINPWLWVSGWYKKKGKRKKKESGTLLLWTPAGFCTMMDGWAESGAKGQKALRDHLRLLNVARWDVWTPRKRRVEMGFVRSRRLAAVSGSICCKFALRIMTKYSTPPSSLQADSVCDTRNLHRSRLSESPHVSMSPLRKIKHVFSVTRHYGGLSQSPLVAATLPALSVASWDWLLLVCRLVVWILRWKELMQFVATQGHITHWNRLVQLTSRLYGCPAAHPPHPLCQPVCKLHIHISDSYNLPVMLLCTPSQCASSQPWCLKPSGKMSHFAHILPLKASTLCKMNLYQCALWVSGAERKSELSHKWEKSIHCLL